MNAFSTDVALLRLQAAGWSVGEVAVGGSGNLKWLVTGSNGENLLRAEGATQDEAWAKACRDAETLGMLGLSFW